METESEVLKELKKYIGKEIAVIVDFGNEGIEYSGKLYGFEKNRNELKSLTLIDKEKRFVIIQGDWIKLIKLEY